MASSSNRFISRKRRNVRHRYSARKAGCAGQYQDVVRENRGWLAIYGVVLTSSSSGRWSDTARAFTDMTGTLSDEGSRRLEGARLTARQRLNGLGALAGSVSACAPTFASHSGNVSLLHFGGSSHSNRHLSAASERTIEDDKHSPLSYFAIIGELPENQVDMGKAASWSALLCGAPESLRSRRARRCRARALAEVRLAAFRLPKANVRAAPRSRTRCSWWMASASSASRAVFLGQSGTSSNWRQHAAASWCRRARRAAHASERSASTRIGAACDSCSDPLIAIVRSNASTARSSNPPR